jgi:adenylate cyclase
MKLIRGFNFRFIGQRSFGLALVIALLALRVWDPLPLEELRLRTFDLFQKVAPRHAAMRPVVIVDIDEDSIREYGQWPWARTLIADMLSSLIEAGSIAVAFDIIFAEPDRLSPGQAVQYLRQIDSETRQRLLSLPSNDDVLAKVISQGRIVLGQSATNVKSPSNTGLFSRTGIALLGPEPRGRLIEFPHLLHNVDPLERAAAGRGLLSIQPEQDGIVRRVPIIMAVEGRIMPSLSLELLRVVTGAGAILVRTDQSGVRSVAIPGLEIPTDQNGRVWVHFARHEKSRYVSAKDIIQKRVPAEILAGKLVLVGTSAIGLHDTKTTPVHASIPGVDIHAQLLESFLTKSLISAPSYGAVAEIIVSVAAGSLLILLAPLVGALSLLCVALTIAVAFAAGSWFMYMQHQFLIDASFPLLVTGTTYVSVALIGYFREEADRRRIRTAFAQYLSPSLVDQLANSPQSLVLGGEMRRMTILFSDVRGFTTISELYKDNPNGLTKLMNSFLTPTTNAIIARKGTIDKYMGDAIMAFWNAPLPDDEQERNACNAALDMLDCVEDLNKNRQQEDTAIPFVPIAIGIGINTGRCTVGNMGSDLRFQYTVMGDSVNLASRMEGQTKFYGVPIIVGSATAAAVADDFALLEIDLIRVKGKSEAEAIYAVLGRGEFMRTDEFQRLQLHWSTLLRSYRSRQWDEARRSIEHCRSLVAPVRLAQLFDLYSERINEYEYSPPSHEWDGVYVAETK